MRTNNARVKGVIISIYLVLIVVAIIMATVFSAFSSITQNPALSFGLVVIGFIIALVGLHSAAKYFEYDSDGMKVAVISKGMLLSDYFNYREHKIEFDKEDLISYKLHNLIIYKSLVLHVKSRNGNSKKERFNVTLVNRKKLKYIKQSLRKMVRNNRKNATD